MRLLSWFFSQKPEPKIPDLKYETWRILTGITEYVDIDDLPMEDRRGIYQDCRETLDNRGFNVTMNNFMKELGNHIIKNVEDKQILTNVRSAILALEELKKRLEMNAENLRERPQEEFDQYKPF